MQAIRARLLSRALIVVVAFQMMGVRDGGD